MEVGYQSCLENNPSYLCQDDKLLIVRKRNADSLSIILYYTRDYTVGRCATSSLITLIVSILLSNSHGKLAKPVCPGSWIFRYRLMMARSRLASVSYKPVDSHSYLLSSSSHLKPHQAIHFPSLTAKFCAFRK